MRKLKCTVFIMLLTLISGPLNPAYSLSLNPQIAPDRESGYDRTFFKHWIDADRNGCDSRAEVLISEAVVKPKIGKQCKLTGGKWLSPYDKKSVSNASQLDVDHLVPLAEAWRSGAWAWTSTQRQDFANDLSDKRALIAVTLSTNRSKGDKDISEWVPKVDTCGYVQNWIAIKIRYSLTYDAKEAAALTNYFDVCKIGNISVSVLPGYTYQSGGTQAPVTDSAPAQFKMPYIQGEGKLVTALSKWSTFGFANAPVVVQAPSALKEYSCKPISNNDWILDVFPKWNSLVDVNTQVTITTMCTIDLDSLKSPTPTASAAPSNTPTPKAPTPTASPTASATPSTSATPTPSPSPTPAATSQAGTITPGAFCSPAGATAKSSSGVTYTCKTSATENKNRWRQ